MRRPRARPGALRAWGLPCLLVIVASATCPTTAQAVDMTSGPSGTRLSKRVTTLKELKTQHVVFQQYDFSCGAAAIATLLTYYFGEPVTEEEIVLGIAERADMTKVLQRRAFSLLDMKRFAEAQGYTAIGYRMDLDFLVGLDRPVIVPVVLRDYKHFVIFKGIVGDRAVIADPAFGNYTMRIGRFLSVWPARIGFVLKREKATGPLSQEAIERQARFMPSQRLHRITAGTVSPSFVPIPGQVQSVTGPRPLGGSPLDFFTIQVPVP